MKIEIKLKDASSCEGCPFCARNNYPIVYSYCEKGYEINKGKERPTKCAAENGI